MNRLSPRARGLVFAVVALAALLGLASSLNALQLDPGTPRPLGELAPQVYDSNLPETWQSVALAFFRVLLIVAWLLLPLFVVMLVVSKRFRKQLLRDLMIYLPIILLLLLISRGATGQRAVEEIAPGRFDMGELEAMQGEELPLPVYTPPAPWVTDLAAALLAVGIAGAMASFGYLLYRRSRKKPEPLHRIQQEAQDAIDAIAGGADLREVILRCYSQMIHALETYRNIHRDRYMTPHEFEAYLEGRGLPREPVRQLTALFEQVRYGGVRPGRADERTAISSLEAIVAACQKSVSAGESQQ